MAKITFMGAGSTVFAKSILGDSLLTPSLQDSHIALYDIDGQRLRDSKMMMDNLNANINRNRARITAHLGVSRRRAALRGADYVVNAIQVGRYEPSTVIDFEVPKRYGLRQTIGDTLGIGGIFRALRTIPVLLDFVSDMAAVCPDAWLLNYTNPMAMLMGAVLRTGVKGVGLCHSVQDCARPLLRKTGLLDTVKKLEWEIAGINHQAWLLSVRDGDKDLYPLIRKIAQRKVREVMRKGARNILQAAKTATHHVDGSSEWRKYPLAEIASDLVRLEVLRNFGYYVTESSEHTAEYTPWFIKGAHPELIEKLDIPLDEYPRRCIRLDQRWKKQRQEMVQNARLTHAMGHEFGSYIMNAMETDAAVRIHGNVLNRGLITNLPANACVEVACLVDRNGVQPTVVGDLPEQCAALNRTNINPQLLTIEAAMTRKKEYIYQAALLDPHTAAELTIDQIRNLCDDLIEAHGDMLPKYR